MDQSEENLDEMFSTNLKGHIGKKIKYFDRNMLCFYCSRKVSQQCNGSQIIESFLLQTSLVRQMLGGHHQYLGPGNAMWELSCSYLKASSRRMCISPFSCLRLTKLIKSYQKSEISYTVFVQCPLYNIQYIVILCLLITISQYFPNFHLNLVS